MVGRNHLLPGRIQSDLAGHGNTKLLPILRAHGMTFYAFRGLASGFLTGNAVNNQKTGTHFGEENPLRKAMQKVFGAEDLTEAMKRFDIEVKAHGLKPVEVAVRWLAHPSVLRDDDGIVLGASRTTQITEAVSLIEKGRLVWKKLRKPWGLATCGPNRFGIGISYGIQRP
ncbi:hypothetical protein DL768_003402 [Monosporascus sp. mg162]|nr:hypothetical protein DL768_003402 [Monosporascus sp. mg162]